MARSYEPWTNERLDAILLEKGGTIERLGQVDRFRDKVDVRCKTCGHEWKATPQSLSLSGCPECKRHARIGSRRKVKYTYEEVKELFAQAGYKLLTDHYENNKQVLELIDLHTGEKCTKTLRAFLMNR